MSVPLISEPPTVAKSASGTVVVRERREVADGVVEFTLARPDGTRLPDWAPGAHIDVVLPDGQTRQYSLCGDRWDAETYRISVQREPDGRGGSQYLHEYAQVGSELGFGGPRNNFHLSPSARYLFVAGGIGITPLVPMIRQAEMLNLDWHLLYLGRSRARLAYLDELLTDETRVTVVAGEERLGFALDDWRPTDPAVRVYSCGPTRLLDAVASWGSVPGGHPPKIERFTAAQGASALSAAFEVVAERSGVRTVVQRDETIVAALQKVGVEVLTSCSQGVCGTCETGVVSGVPDHRDSLLDDDERAESACMFPCVSRCSGARLVLDL